MGDEPGGRIACATYTHARRHPMVIGQIGGWTPPFQLSLAQIVVLLATVVVEAQTWRWWGVHLPRFVSMVVAAGVPCLLTWLVRRGRLEGRSLARTALGWLALLGRPRNGRVGGRPHRPVRAPLVGPARVFVAPGDTVGRRSP
jgi:hypothetical protein